MIAGILLVGILATALAGCKNADVTKKEREKPVITLAGDSYPPYNYLNEDGSPQELMWNWLQKLSEGWGIRWMLSRSTGRRKKNW